MTIWKRYFFTEWAKVFCLFLSCMYFLYVLIDVSAHAKVFQQDSIRWIDGVLYYLYQFSQRADVLIVFASLIATIKVLTTLNVRNELVALVVSGLPLKKLLNPFLAAAGSCALLLYLNFQFLCPLSLQKLNAFEERFFHDKTKEDRVAPVNHLFLKDNTLLVFNNYDPHANYFLDAYWIRSFDDIYRIKKLYPLAKTAEGLYVDHIVRSSLGTMVRKESLEKEVLKMEFEGKSLYAAAHPPRWQSLSKLVTDIPWKQIGWGLKKMNDREAQSVTIFYYKLLLPLACILAVIAPARDALRFGRTLRVFLIYTLSLFGMITFFTLVNSSVILGESQVLPPTISVSLPFLASSLIFGWRYAKL